MRKNKTVLYVTTRLFWPPDDGRKVTLFNYCKGMNGQLGYDVHVFSFLEGGQEEEAQGEKPSFISSVTVARRVGVCDKARNAARALVDESMPLQSCLFMSKDNQGLLRNLVDRINPDVVLIDMVRLAPYMCCLSSRNSAIVINFDDLLSKRYVRQQGQSNGDILGKYGSSTPKALNRIVNGRLRNLILKTEARRVEAAEVKYAKLADSCLFVSSIEAAELDSRLNCRKSFSATIGAEANCCGSSKLGCDFDFGFVGNMHTSANRDALRYLMNKVMPLLPGRTLCVIGVCPDEVQREYEKYDSVCFTGWVDSIGEHLTRCAALLAPFAYGTGIKTKILEAMGMGVPVITNSIGLEGIEARDGVEVLCADTPEGLAEAAEMILQDPILREQISLNGYEYVKKNHSWEKSISNLGECLDYAISMHERGKH